MPFTPAHAAAAIPFRRTRLIMSAIVMGCFVPDFPHFLFLPHHVYFSHTVAGMFALDLPLALIALWFFHAFIKQPLLMFLPRGVRRRLPKEAKTFSFRPTGRFGLIVVSVLAGTATHLLWDAFTHDDSWMFLHWALLRRWVALPLAGPMPMYTLLEYGSSVFGVAVVAVWIWHWYRATLPSALPAERMGNAARRRLFLITLPLVAIAGGALRSWHKHGIHLRLRPVVHFTADMLVAAITFFLVELLVAGVILRRKKPVPSCTAA